MKLAFLLFTIVMGQTAFSQLKVTGRIVDIESQLPIQFAHIFTSEAGTVSNGDGEFQLNMKQKDLPVVFSHIGYEKITILFNREIDTLIQLKASPVYLEEVVVNGSGVVSIIQNTFTKIIDSSFDENFYCFYRQTTRNDNVYSELLEVFYKTDISSNGISKWRINQGRYAVRTDFEKEGYIVNRNFSIFTKRLPLSLKDPRSYIVPLMPNAEDYYDFKLNEIRKSSDTLLYYISFAPKKDCPYSGFKGTIIIDDEYNIHRFSGVIKDSRFNPLDDRIKDKVSNIVFQIDVLCDIKIKENRFPSTIQNQLSYDYQVDKRKVRKVKSQSIFTIVSHSKIQSNFEDTTPENDFKSINETSYNEAFWEANEIIKRTPVERELLRQFKSINGFTKTFGKK